MPDATEKIAPNLKWMAEFSQFDETEQKLLVALSHQKYKWRTKDRLSAATDLTLEDLNKTLEDLMRKNVVRTSISRNKNIIFGLRERVG